MTGEQSKSEVTREAFPLHFAIADAIGGEVRPFDKYQGPYIATKAARLWLVSADGYRASVYNETADKESNDFPAYTPDAAAVAVAMARTVI